MSTRKRFDYADVVVTEKRRLRVSFNQKLTAKEVLSKLRADDIYDVTEEENLEYISIDEIWPLSE